MEVGGPDSGRFRVIVDGKEVDKLEIFNTSLDSSIRMEYYFIKSLPYGEHTIKLIHDETPPDKSKLKNQNPQDAAEYEKNIVRVGRILLNGTLLDANK